MCVVKNTPMEEGIKSFGMEAKLFLQIDLAGHSLWISNAKSRPDAVNSRAEFADSVTEALENHGFYRLCWLGDGGMFTHDFGSSDLNYAINAADTVFQIFSEWRKEKKDREILQLRLSIHNSTQPVYVHEEPGYWAGEDLNVFSKNEREIGEPGTTVITDTVWGNLTGDMQERFPENTKKDFLPKASIDGNALIKYVYYDIHHEHPEYPSIQSLAAFLKQLSKKIKLMPDERVGPSSAIPVVFGDAILLKGICSPLENLQVYLKKCDPSSYNLTPEKLGEIKRDAEALKRKSIEHGFEDKWKVSPQRIVYPLSDFPLLEVEWHPERWSIVRTFHKLLENNQSDNSTWHKLAEKAADTQVKGLKYPGILCMHILIRTAPDTNNKRFVLLCQRNERGPEGFFHEGKWSCSIEEQVTPGETIERCVQRGISEELLGSQASEHLEVKVVAAFLERVLLNLTLLTVVDIPMSYEDIVERWLRDAIDKDEHRQLVAFPLRKELVVECLKSGQLGPNVRNACVVSDKQTFSSTTKWDLHPTSPLRLATALWLKTLGGK